MPQTFPVRRYILRPGVIAERLDAHHLRQRDLAADLGLSRSHLSKLIQGNHSLSPKVRRALLDHSAFVGLPEAELWQVLAPLRGQLPLPCSPDATERGAA